jgi:hypothetical protein
MPPGGALRNSHTGFDRATTVPAALRTCSRTNDASLLSTVTLAEPELRAVALSLLYVAVFGTVPV